MGTNTRRTAASDADAGIVAPDRTVPAAARAGREAGAGALPTFLIAGAAKCGSSTLHDYLSRHDDVFLSPQKETGFFTAGWERGRAHYASFFSDHRGERAIGEATVEYMVDPRAPARIAELLPDVRLVFTLRDPIDRARSHYWHRIKAGHERRSLDAVFGADDLADDYPVRYGLYWTHLRRFLAHFPRERILVVLLEDMRREPAATFARVFEFVGVDPTRPVDFDGARNIGRTARSPRLQRLLRRIHDWPVLQRAIPRALRPLVGRTYTRFKRWNTRPLDDLPLPAEHVATLASVFAPQIDGLEHFLGRSLHDWRAPYAALRR